MLVLAVLGALLAACQSVRLFADLPKTEGAETEECLIDFSQKMQGHLLSAGPLPATLDAEQFFRILDPYYTDKACLRTVQAYPVQVVPKGESYALSLCDTGRHWVLYEDWGDTMDRVDRPYVREQLAVPCPAN
jgi:hypothetical protein